MNFQDGVFSITFFSVAMIILEWESLPVNGRRCDKNILVRLKIVLKYVYDAIISVLFEFDDRFNIIYKYSTFYSLKNY